MKRRWSLPRIVQIASGILKKDVRINCSSLNFWPTRLKTVNREGSFIFTCKLQLERLHALSKTGVSKTTSRILGRRETPRTPTVCRKPDLWWQAEQDNLADAEEKVAQLVNQKADYEEQLRELEERLAEAEASNEEKTAKNRQLDEKLDNLKKEKEDMELNLQRAEQEKQTKDSQIRTLTEELTRQEENMARVNRDKRNLEELLKKTQDDLASEEDKCNSLNKTKQKLEQSVDEVIRSRSIYN